MKARFLITTLLAAISLAAAAQPAVETTVDGGKAEVRLTIPVKTAQVQTGTFITRILYREYIPGRIIEHVVAESRNIEHVWDGKNVIQTFEVDPVLLWTPATPTVYYARTSAEFSGGSKENYETTFLFRGPRPAVIRGAVLPAGKEGWDEDHWECCLRQLKLQGINAVAGPASLLPVCDYVGMVLMEADDSFLPYAQILDEDFFPVGREFKGGAFSKLSLAATFRSKSLTLVQVQATDRNNRLVENPPITFEVSGPAVLESAGKASAFIRHTGPGPVTVTLKTKNRPNVVMTLQ